MEKRGVIRSKIFIVTLITFQTELLIVQTIIMLNSLSLTCGKVTRQVQNGTLQCPLITPTDPVRVTLN